MSVDLKRLELKIHLWSSNLFIESKIHAFRKTRIFNQLISFVLFAHTKMLPLFRSLLTSTPSHANLQYLNITVRNATKKAGGTVKNGRDSIGKRMGLKKNHLQPVIPGNIIIRQRGKKYYPGEGVGLGKDYTIYSLIEGSVRFKWDSINKRTYVNVVPPGTPIEKAVVKEKPFVNRGYNVPLKELAKFSVTAK